MKGWFSATVLAVVLLDQASKWWITITLLPGQSIPIVSGVLHFTLTYNAGIAFGLFSHHGHVFLWLSLFISLGITAYYLRLRTAPAWLTLAVGLLVGGALGNIVDRVRLGHVVDFVDLRVFPIFNVSDIAITCATVLWIVKQWIPVKGEAPQGGNDGTTD